MLCVAVHGQQNKVCLKQSSPHNSHAAGPFEPLQGGDLCADATWRVHDCFAMCMAADLPWADDCMHLHMTAFVATYRRLRLPQPRLHGCRAPHGVDTHRRCVHQTPQRLRSIMDSTVTQHFCEGCVTTTANLFEHDTVETHPQHKHQL